VSVSRGPFAISLWQLICRCIDFNAMRQGWGYLLDGIYQGSDLPSVYIRRSNARAGCSSEPLSNTRRIEFARTERVYFPPSSHGGLRCLSPQTIFVKFQCRRARNTGLRCWPWATNVAAVARFGATVIDYRAGDSSRLCAGSQEGAREELASTQPSQVPIAFRPKCVARSSSAVPTVPEAPITRIVSPRGRRR
jgi:hypothetical protein